MKSARLLLCSSSMSEKGRGPWHAHICLLGVVAYVIFFATSSIDASSAIAGVRGGDRGGAARRSKLPSCQLRPDALFGLQHAYGAPGLKARLDSDRAEPIERSHIRADDRPGLIVLFLFWRQMTGLLLERENRLALHSRACSAKAVHRTGPTSCSAISDFSASPGLEHERGSERRPPFREPLFTSWSPPRS